MRMVDVIAKKRDNGELSREEINFFIEGFTSGEVADYQASALAMAIVWRGMTPRETTDLTLAMAASGQQLDLSQIAGIKVDKHSTGGVGDTVTLIATPLAAACGLKIAKMSGRGLGHTGGTIDKLESIPGFRVELSSAAFMRQVEEVGLAVIAQSKELAPADGKLYALRDVTATVGSLPLIASSVMSKKLAAGADVIVLDVKYGRGAFMPDAEQAKALAQAMVEIGQGAGRKVSAVVSSMQEPLGNAIGNALEVAEAIQLLRGEAGSAPLLEMSILLTGELLRLADFVKDRQQGELRAREALASGHGLAKLAEFIRAQGGDDRVCQDLGRLPQAKTLLEVTASKAGFIQRIDPLGCAAVATELGAGRSRKEDTIDPSVGLVLAVRHGAVVKAGDLVAVIHAASPAAAAIAGEKLAQAIQIGTESPAPLSLVEAIIE